MSIKESQTEINPTEEDADNPILEGDFDIVPRGKKDLVWKRHVFNLGLIILTASAAFGLGRISSIEEHRQPVIIRSADKTPLPSDPLVDAVNVNSDGAVAAGSIPNDSTLASAVVASKNGNKYYYPSCSGAKRIADANKITFASINAARKAGYTPAANCNGLK